MSDKTLKHAAVLEVNLDACLVLFDGFIDIGGDPLLQRHDGRFDDCLVGELAFAGATCRDRQCRDIKHTELAFEAGPRIPLRGQFHDDRMDIDIDAFDLISGQLVFITKLNASVDHGVDDQAASVRLVGVAVNLETVAEAVGDDGEVVFGAD